MISDGDGGGGGDREWNSVCRCAGDREFILTLQAGGGIWSR